MLHVVLVLVHTDTTVDVGQQAYFWSNLTGAPSYLYFAKVPLTACDKLQMKMTYSGFL